MSRYIDADKLKDIKFNSISNDKYGIYRMGWNDAIDAVVDNEPTADVRENVRGEWIHDEITRNGNTVYTPNAKCSICYCYVFQESNFCPNCGADMRGDKK